jgi:hypothetical protein
MIDNISAKIVKIFRVIYKPDLSEDILEIVTHSGGGFILSGLSPERMIMHRGTVEELESFIKDSDLYDILETA